MSALYAPQIPVGAGCLYASTSHRLGTYAETAVEIRAPREALSKWCEPSGADPAGARIARQRCADVKKGTDWSSSWRVPRSLRSVLAGLTPLDEDFPSIDDSPPEPVDPLMAGRYLLDTNILSRVAVEPHGSTAARLLQAGEARLCTSVIVSCELKFGLLKKGSARLTAQVEALLAVVPVLPLDGEVDEQYARLRYALEKRGQPIGQTICSSPPTPSRLMQCW